MVPGRQLARIRDSFLSRLWDAEYSSCAWRHLSVFLRSRYTRYPPRFARLSWCNRQMVCSRNGKGVYTTPQGPVECLFTFRHLHDSTLGAKVALCAVLYDDREFKGIVHPKIKMLSSFTRSDVLQPYMTLLLHKTENILFSSIHLSVNWRFKL